MKFERFKKLVIPPGPILSVTLLGIMLLCGLLYYRAVKIQRFLEPALAISQPRSEFAHTVNSLLAREFPDSGGEIKFEWGSIVVKEALIFDRSNRMKPSAPLILNRLSNVILTILSDQQMRFDIDLILITSEYPLSTHAGSSTPDKHAKQRKAEAFLAELFRGQPLLEKEYPSYFASAALPRRRSHRAIPIIELRFIPSEQLHIKVLQSLRKYVH